MPRRRTKQQKTSFAEDAAELIVVASQRWAPAGFVFCAAFVSFGVYLLIHPTMLLGFARYVGPVAIAVGLACAGLAVHGLLERRRTSVFESTLQSPHTWTAETIAALSWQQFERLIADLFRRQGYTVRETGQDAQAAGVGDGGVDLVLTDPRSPGAEFLVQCKQYRVWSVGEPKVREFYGAMAAWKTRCEGIVITCGRFTHPAETFAAGKPLRLIDGDGLLQLLHQHNPLAPAVTTAAPPSVQAISRPLASAAPTNPASPPHAPPATSPGVPACPNCQVAMVRRVAEKGQWKGQAFWGCVNYPACRAIINIAT